ncbi:MAG: YncE family protein [candidate division WOR-3 bacterium]
MTKRLGAFLAALVAFACGQYLEATIRLSDSLGTLAVPRCLAYNSTNNTVYVGGEHGNCVVAIDGATNQKIARIPVGFAVYAILYNQQENKVYCADYHADNVIIVNGATNRVTSVVPVGDCPYALGFNPLENKVYCGNFVSDDVTIIDGRQDSILATVHTGVNPWAFCCATRWPCAGTPAVTRSTAPISQAMTLP